MAGGRPPHGGGTGLVPHTGPAVFRPPHVFPHCSFLFFFF